MSHPPNNPSSEPSTQERDALFGKLAGQLGLVSPEDLDAAKTAPTATSLADTLEARGGLSSAHRQLLDHFVEDTLTAIADGELDQTLDIALAVPTARSEP